MAPLAGDLLCHSMNQALKGHLPPGSSRFFSRQHSGERPQGRREELSRRGLTVEQIGPTATPAPSQGCPTPQDAATSGCTRHTANTGSLMLGKQEGSRSQSSWGRLRSSHSALQRLGGVFCLHLPRSIYRVDHSVRMCHDLAQAVTWTKPLCHPPRFTY